MPSVSVETEGVFCTFMEQLGIFCEITVIKKGNRKIYVENIVKYT